MGPERTLLGLSAQGPVFSLSRITLENNGKIRPEPDRENAFARASGGGGGIRTHGTLSRTPVFKTGAFDHSATPPRRFSGYSASRGLASARRSEHAGLAPKGFSCLARNGRLAAIGAQAPFDRATHSAGRRFVTRAAGHGAGGEARWQERRVVFWDWRYRHWPR